MTPFPEQGMLEQITDKAYYKKMKCLAGQRFKGSLWVGLYEMPLAPDVIFSCKETAEALSLHCLTCLRYWFPIGDQPSHVQLKRWRMERKNILKNI